MLQRVKEKNILHKIKRREAHWIGRVLLTNCLLKHVIEGKTEVMVRRGKRRKKILDGLKEDTINLKNEAVDHPLW